MKKKIYLSAAIFLFAVNCYASFFIPNLGVGTEKIANSAVTTEKIANSAVTQSKLAARPFSVSSNTALFHVKTPTWTHLSSLDISLALNSRPVVVGLTSNSSGTETTLSCYSDVFKNPTCGIRIVKGSSVISEQVFGISQTGPAEFRSTSFLPASSINVIDDTLMSGSHTYRVYVNSANVSTDFTSAGFRLFAYEL